MRGGSVATVPVQIQAGEPSLVDLCASCGGSRYEFPIAGLLRSGVTQVGSLTLCPGCDTPDHVVREHVVRKAHEA